MLLATTQLARHCLILSLRALCSGILNKAKNLHFSLRINSARQSRFWTRPAQHKKMIFLIRMYPLYSSQKTHACQLEIIEFDEGVKYAKNKYHNHHGEIHGRILTGFQMV